MGCARVAWAHATALVPPLPLEMPTTSITSARALALSGHGCPHVCRLLFIVLPLPSQPRQSDIDFKEGHGSSWPSSCSPSLKILCLRLKDAQGAA